MLDSCQNAQERWGGVHKLIDRWLEERKELITAFITLRDASPAFADKSLNEPFCQILVDYVSAWHFEICEQLVSEAKAFADTRGLQIMESHRPRLEEITEHALKFNDHCSEGECNNTDRFAVELKKLGLLLHERFDLEDGLIDVLHTAHKTDASAVQA
ncbi:MAG: sigma D regulator [Pseudomonas sp.]|uniref:sigma D regulator n=1 Tax=Pseudomonas sp. TaxID=306 RepID=UPI003D131A71